MKVPCIRFNYNNYNKLYFKSSENICRNEYKAVYPDAKLPVLPDYFRPHIASKVSSCLDTDKLSGLNIPNFHVVNNHIVRGESLSSKKNRKFLAPVRKCGIEGIVDLRDKYTSLKYEDLCKEYGFKYYHIPVDSDSVEDIEIIKNFNKLFHVLDNEAIYIACAQGLHRTDIALALNYIFNPRSQANPPVMYGHMRNFGFKQDDIMRRINSINKAISDDDMLLLGWNDNNYRNVIEMRKKNLAAFNKNYAQKYLPDNQ